jgi:hypothetical protein
MQMENAKLQMSEKLQKQVANIKRQKTSNNVQAEKQLTSTQRIKPKAKGPNPLSVKKKKVS